MMHGVWCMLYDDDDDVWCMMTMYVVWCMADDVCCTMMVMLSVVV